MTDGAESEHYFALPTGSRLYEFEIETLLGHGGFGITYRATDTLLQETVAIKEFLPNELAVRVSDATVRAKSRQQQPEFELSLRSFLEEARMMARFRHPRIVHVRRFFELHGTGYIVLDYERGSTLSERLSDGPIPAAEVHSVLFGVLDGLEVIHNRAILHRDLKPNNIMLRKDGGPVIIDFGAARDFQTRHSRSITAIATAGYSPPEQYGVGGEQGPWSDLYALGAIAYRAVIGMPPVDSLRRLRNDPLVPAVVAGAGRYDEVLLRTIDWMLKIDEAERPGSAAEVREALRGGGIPAAALEVGRPASDGGRTTASPGAIGLAQSSGGGAPAAARPFSRRGKTAAAAAGLLVLAGLAAGSYAFYADHQTRQPGPADQQAKQQAERQLQQAKEQRQQRLVEQLANAGTDQSKLEQFLASCGSDCPNTLRAQAQARIETEKQQKDEAEKKRRRELWAQRLEQASFNQVAIEQLLRTCDTSCPADIKEQAQRRHDLIVWELSAYQTARDDPDKLRAYIENCKACNLKSDAEQRIKFVEAQKQKEIKQKQETDRLEREEGRAYQAARGDLQKLQHYVSTCTVCSFSEAANQSIVALQQANALEEKMRRDEQAYRQARGNLNLLKDYVQNCATCTYKVSALEEITKLENDAQLFMLKVCNKSSRKASVAVMGRTMLENNDWHVQGWWSVPPGQCNNIRRYVKGVIHLFAQEDGNPSFAWKGNASQLCVDTPGPFDRVNRDGYTCQGGEKAVRFSTFSVSDRTFTWDLNP